MNQFSVWNVVKVMDDAKGKKDEPHELAGKAGVVRRVSENGVVVQFDEGMEATVDEKLLKLISQGP